MKKPASSHSWLFAAGLVVVGLLLRLPLLNGSFWLDEAAQALESARPLSEQLQIAYDFQPPLMHLLIHFALYISREEWWLRTVGALIPGLISLWASYKIGLKIFNQKVAIWSTLLLATSSFHLFYSQELRPYALPLMFGCLSWLVLLHWPKPNTKVSFLKRYPILSIYSAYTILTLLGLYSSYLYPFLIIGQAVYIGLMQRQLLSTYLYHSFFWVLGFLPWLPFLAEQFSVSSELRQQLPGWEKVVSIEAVRSLALVIGKFMFGVLDLRFSLFFAAGTVLFLLLTGFGVSSLFLQKIKSSSKSKILHDISIVLIWLIVPLGTAWFISLLVPVLHPKRVLYLLPAFYLLVVASIENLPHPKFRTLAIGLLLTINLYGTFQYYTQPRLQRENWRELHSLITHLYPTNSITLFSFPEPFAPWIWYDQAQHPAKATGTLAIKDANLDKTLQECDNYTYVLVFDYLRSLTDPDNQLLASLKSRGFSEMDFFDQTNIGFVRIYAQPQQQAAVLN